MITNLQNEFTRTSDECTRLTALLDEKTRAVELLISENQELKAQLEEVMARAINVETENKMLVDRWMLQKMQDAEKLNEPLHNIAPEYACTGMLNEKSDVYSFGILIMEIISGRNPVDYSRPKGDVNLVDWLKTMVGNQKSEEVVDPKLPEIPISKALKCVLLVVLRCVDPDA